MAVPKGCVSVTAIVKESDHTALQVLLAGKKLLPLKNFSDWLRAKEDETVNPKKKGKK